VDKKRIESAFYHPESKPETRVGVANTTPKSLEISGLLGLVFSI